MYIVINGFHVNNLNANTLKSWVKKWRRNFSFKKNVNKWFLKTPQNVLKIKIVCRIKKLHIFFNKSVRSKKAIKNYKRATLELLTENIWAFHPRWFRENARNMFFDCVGRNYHHFFGVNIFTQLQNQIIIW